MPPGGDPNSNSIERFAASLQTFEHIIEKAGLSESEALDSEEIEVEKRILYPLFKRGLNMIPGGRAGLRFIRNWTKRTGYHTDEVVNVDNVEKMLDNIQNYTLQQNRKSSKGKINAKLAKFWAEDLDFRIRVITHRDNRFSLGEILLIRRLYASGWSQEKIYSALNKRKENRVSPE